MREVVLGMKGPMRNSSSEAKDGAPRVAYWKHLGLLRGCFESELWRAMSRWVPTFNKEQGMNM